MLNSLFKIIFLAEFILAAIIRKSYTTKYRKRKIILDAKTTTDIVLLALNGIGMVIPIVYVFSSSLDFADYSLPPSLGFLGAVFFLFAIILLWRSHADLGKNWTPTLGIRYHHQIITNGVFKYIRHPMYAAHILWAIAQIMILHNWIAGYSFIIAMIPQYLSRVKNEESMMLNQFGEAYQEYMNRTGRIFPRLSKK